MVSQTLCFPCPLELFSSSFPSKSCFPVDDCTNRACGGSRVNESAGDQIAEILGTHLDLTEESLESPDDIVDDAPVARAREGLPRSFRMRHDAHYVDEL